MEFNFKKQINGQSSVPRRDSRKLEIGDLLAECANRANDRNLNLAIGRVEGELEGVAVPDPTLFVEAILKSIEAVGTIGGFKTRLSVRFNSEIPRTKRVEIVLASEYSLARESSLTEGLRSAARFSVLKTWLQENEVRSQDWKSTEKSVSIRLIFETQSIDEYGEGESRQPASKGRVLLVEDYRESCTLYAEVLQEWGYSVATAHSAEKAIHILDTEPGFDIGIFDLNLPGISGEQLADYCRAHYDLLSMKLVAISGESCRLPNRLFNACLAKPFGHTELKRTLDFWAKNFSAEN